MHDRGAPHLADPSRLLASAERIYGDEMEALWGRVLPVPERNLRVLRGRRDARGRRPRGSTSSTRPATRPTTSSTSTGPTGPPTWATWPACGSRRPDFVRPPTPPPDIDVDGLARSIDLVAERRPARLALTHFGMVDDPQPHLEQAAMRLREQAALVRVACSTSTATPTARRWPRVRRGGGRRAPRRPGDRRTAACSRSARRSSSYGWAGCGATG